MVIYTLNLQFYFKSAKEKRRRYLSEETKPEEKQNSATVMISVDKRGIVFRVKLKLLKALFDSIYYKENFEKDLINSIDSNDQINLTSDDSLSSNDLLKSQHNAKNFNTSFYIVEVVQSTVILLQRLLQE